MSGKLTGVTALSVALLIGLALIIVVFQQQTRTVEPPVALFTAIMALMAGVVLAIGALALRT